VSYAFNNKIENFEGDNDNVEEEIEYESSAEKSFLDNSKANNILHSQVNDKVF
jgi:hypothetical protein